jgi:formamidopyrimidine-DNA glycosylase
MPELPDILVYQNALNERVVGEPVERVRAVSPFFVRTFDPPLEAVVSKRVEAVTRLGKRIVLRLDDGLCLVIHLMIAGRFRWKDEPGAKLPGKIGLAAFDCPTGTLLITEAGSKKRASLHVVRGSEELAQHDRGGLEPLDTTLEQFRESLAFENHTFKRSLTDPRIFSGIGNAYSDEILHAARLSPVKQTARLSEDEISRLHSSTQSVLEHWIEHLHNEFQDRFPGAGEITAFRPEFAVHGKYGQPCPECDTQVQRIRYAGNETNYCPRCQTEGKLLADRSLSRLLKSDWPKTIEELEEDQNRV